MVDSRKPLTPKQAGESYYAGLNESASLKRARKPYQVRNLLTGAAIVAFIGGVYLYSISAVKQDDFSDVVDLIPLPEDRVNIVSIEDEIKAKERAAKELVALGAENTSAAFHQASEKVASGTHQAKDAAKSGVLALLPGRLSEVQWIKNRGWVEEGKGNVLVWGAPNVDKIGSMKENFGVAGGRRVV